MENIGELSLLKDHVKITFIDYPFLIFNRNMPLFGQLNFSLTRLFYTGFFYLGIFTAGYTMLKYTAKAASSLYIYV